MLDGFYYLSQLVKFRHLPGENVGDNILDLCVECFVQVANLRGSSCYEESMNFVLLPVQT